MADATATVNVDLILKAGKVFGDEDLKKLLTQAVAAIKLPPTVVKANIKIDDSLESVRSKINGMSAQINRALTEGIQSDGKVLEGATKDQFKAAKQSIGRIDELYGRQQSLNNKRFNSPEFQRAYEAFSRGEITDDAGQVHKVNTKELANLRKVKGLKDVFPPGIASSVAKYNSELAKLLSLLRQIDTATGRTKAGPKGEKTPPSYLAAEADSVQNSIAQVKKNLLSDDEIKKVEDKEAADRKQRYARQEKELARARERATSRRNKEQQTQARARAKQEADLARARARTAAEDKKDAQRRLQKRQDNRLDQRGKKTRRQIAKGQVVGLQDYKDAAFSVTRELNNVTGAAKKLDAQDTVKYRKRVDALRKSANKLRGELDAVNAAGRNLGKNIGTAPLVKKGLTPAQAQQRVEGRNAIIEGRRAFDRSGGFGGSFSASAKELGALADFHKAKIAQITRIRSKLNDKTEQGRAAYSRLGKALFRHGRDLEATTQHMRTFGGATQQTAALFRQFFRYAIGYGALYQALAAIRALIAGVVDLDKALKGIQAVTQATNKEMALIETGIKAVATETQFNAKDISEAALILGQAGVIPTELPAALRATALFASATGSAIQLSADLVTSMRNVFGTLGDQTIANQLTQAINISKLTAADLKTIISLSSQIAKAYGLATDQYLAAATTLRNAGIKPSTVATGLRQGLIEIFSPDSKTVKALQLRYQQLGEQLSIDEVRDKFFGFSLTDSPLVSALRELQRLGFTGEGKKVFQRAYDVRAENAISALINNIGELEASSAKLTFGESAIVAAQTQMESLAHSFSNLLAAISVLTHDLAGPMVSGFESLADAATKGVKALTEMNLQMELLTGHGLVRALGAGAVGLATGATFQKGGILSKILIGTAASKAAYDVSKDTSLEATSREGAEAVVAGFWGSLLDAGKTALTVAVPLLAIELFNLVRGAKSPLLENAYGKAYGTKKAARRAPGIIGNIAKPVLGTSVRKGSLAAKAVKGVTGARGTIASLALFFGLGIFKELAKAVKFAFGVLKGSPVLLAVTGLLAVISIATKIFDSFSSKDTKSRLAAARKAKRRADQNAKNFEDSSAEFRLGKGGKQAAEGTTAASVDKLFSDIQEYESAIGNFFGENSEDINGLTEKLSDLGKYSPESGSTVRLQGLDALKSAIDTSAVKGTTTDEVISNLSNRANGFIGRAEALRTSMATYLTNLKEKGDDIDASSRAFLQAFQEINGNDIDKQALLFGLNTGKDPLTQAKEVAALTKQILNRQQELYAASAEGQKVHEDQLRAAEDEIDQLTETIINSDSVEDMVEVVNQFVTSLFGLTDAGADNIKQMIGIMEGNAERFSGQLKAVRLFEARLETLDAELKNKGAGLSNKEVVEKLAERKRIQAALDKLPDASYLESKAEGNQLALDEANRAQRANFYAQELSSFRDIDEFRRKLDAAIRDFGPGAGRGRTQLETALPVGTEDAPSPKRELIDELLSLKENPVKYARLLTTDEEGKLPEELEKFQESFKTFEKFRKEIARQSAEYQGAFRTSLAEANKIADVESAIKRAKKSKSFDKLTTETESENLYKIQEKLLVEQLTKEINFLQKQPETGDAENDARKKRINDLEIKQKEVHNKAEDSIFAARIDSAKEDLRQFKALNKRKLTGYKTQLAKAVDSGDILEAYRIDALIVGIKKQQLALEIKRLKALGAAEIAAIEGGPGTAEEKALAVAKSRADNALAIANFTVDAEADLTPVLSKPSAVKRIGAQIVSRLDRDVPAKAELSEDAQVRGQLGEQGKVTAAKERNEQRLKRIAANEEEIAKIRTAISAIEADGVQPGEVQGLAEQNEIIAGLREQIGVLKEQATAESGTLALAPQLTQGFDLGNVSNQLDASSSSISNLGKTIQDDLVKGLDDAAGGFATALASGQKFTDGLKASFSAMLRQIAADIIKSGVIKLASLALGGATGGIGAFFSGLFKAKGGVVEAKAAGGEVGGGGQIRGPGTGTSDSVPGVVINSKGQAIRGIRVSNGEGIVTAKAVRALGASFLRKVNTASSNTLRAIRQGKESVGFARGGVPSGLSGLSSVISNATNVAAMRPMQFAAGGVVYDSGKAVKESKTGASTTVDHNFSASVTVEADEDTGVDQGALRQFDDGLTIKIQEYVQDQLRPGGLLQGARSN